MDTHSMKDKAQKLLREKQKQAEEEIANSEFARHELMLQEKKYRQEISVLKEHLAGQIFDIKVSSLHPERRSKGSP